MYLFCSLFKSIFACCEHLKLQRHFKPLHLVSSIPSTNSQDLATIHIQLFESLCRSCGGRNAPHSYTEFPQLLHRHRGQVTAHTKRRPACAAAFYETSYRDWIARKLLIFNLGYSSTIFPSTKVICRSIRSARNRLCVATSAEIPDCLTRAFNALNT